MYHYFCPLSFFISELVKNNVLCFLISRNAPHYTNSVSILENDNTVSEAHDFVQLTNDSCGRMNKWTD